MGVEMICTLPELEHFAKQIIVFDRFYYGLMFVNRGRLSTAHDA